MRFTGAHEIGHYMLHPGEVFHRDRPISEVGSSARPQIEQDADYFAACSLASEKLIKEEFELRFSYMPLPLTDAVAYHLRGEKGQELMRANTGSLEFAAAVAGAHSFGGRRFTSLADRFGLSIKAMVIRLQELGLVGG